MGIIDPGGEADKILREIKKTKVKPKYIINTHCHPDHILANEEIRKETGAKILIHENEKDFIDFEADKFFEEAIKIIKTWVDETLFHLTSRPVLWGGRRMAVYPGHGEIFKICQLKTQL
jgi:glyoxylase-like metal-dependent hydrolase (beta-lactamase superfamily II)